MEHHSQLIIFYDDSHIGAEKVDEILSNLEKYNKGITKASENIM